MTVPRATRVLYGLLAVAVAVSVVHYVDNVVNYADYPVPGPGAPVPAPSRLLVGLGWFLFTAFGVLAVVLWRRGRLRAAAWALAAYSASGLIGFGHYTAPGATDMVWWRQAHIVADIACGIAALAFAVWVVLRLPRQIQSAAPTPA